MWMCGIAEVNVGSVSGWYIALLSRSSKIAAKAFKIVAEASELAN
jgi:hypothetical protein